MEIFVPGRLCILGEHTDWIGTHRVANESIPIGYTFVCATNEGLSARITEHNPFVVRFQHSDTDVVLEEALNITKLKEIAISGGLNRYIAGSIVAILENKKFQTKFPNFNTSIESYKNNKFIDNPIKGLKIDNYSTTLPMRKGLSSSAAVCVLVITGFNMFYELSFTEEEIMELAYLGEIMTKSKCGRMDQCVVMGPETIALMEFDGKECSLRKLKCGKSLYFVVVDLKASKDTVKILGDLNDCFPFPTNDTQKLMHDYAKEIEKIVPFTEKAIFDGNSEDLAKLMKKAQECFDFCATKNCPDQLSSPILHSLINDKKLREISLVVKGVGSQGDGTAQVLCENEQKQAEVLDYLTTKYGFEGFKLTIPASKNEK